MSQFTSQFWDVYVAILSVVSIVACALFLKSQSVRKAPGAASTTGLSVTWWTAGAAGASLVIG